MIKDVLKRYKLDYSYNENFPEDTSFMDLKEVYYIPSLRTFFDEKNKLEYNEIRHLEMLGYKVATSFDQLIYYLETL